MTPLPSIKPNSRSLLFPFGRSYDAKEAFEYENPGVDFYDAYWEDFGTEPMGEEVATPQNPGAELGNVVYQILIILIVVIIGMVFTCHKG